MQQEYLYFEPSNAWFRTDTIWWLILYIALNARKNFSLLFSKHAYLLQDGILFSFLSSIISHMHPDHYFHTYTACAKSTYYLVWPHHTNFIGTNTKQKIWFFPAVAPKWESWLLLWTSSDEHCLIVSSSVGWLVLWQTWYSMTLFLTSKAHQPLFCLLLRVHLSNFLGFIFLSVPLCFCRFSSML